jgi:hypothetical protein
MSKFKELRVLDVSKHTEMKGKFTYLSWAWAVDTLLQHDSKATWTYAEPMIFSETVMVFCSVTAFDKTMTAQLPVLDFRMLAIPKPNAMQVNTAMQRCLAKAIALHGLGLYIYQGEDLPEADVLERITNIYKEQGIDEARKYFNTLDGADRKLCMPFIEKVKENK